PRSPAPRSSSLFPYTTLFRSALAERARQLRSQLDNLGRIVRVGRLVKAAFRQPSRLTTLPLDAWREWRGTHVLPDLADADSGDRSEEHTSELQSRSDLVCRLL